MSGGKERSCGNRAITEHQWDACWKSSLQTYHFFARRMRKFLRGQPGCWGSVHGSYTPTVIFKTDQDTCNITPTYSEELNVRNILVSSATTEHKLDNLIINYGNLEQASKVVDRLCNIPLIINQKLPSLGLGRRRSSLLEERLQHFLLCTWAENVGLPWYHWRRKDYHTPFAGMKSVKQINSKQSAHLINSWNTMKWKKIARQELNAL